MTEPTGQAYLEHEERRALRRSLQVIESLRNTDPAHPTPERKALIEELEQLDKRLIDLHKQMWVREGRCRAG